MKRLTIFEALGLLLVTVMGLWAIHAIAETVAQVVAWVFVVAQG